MKKVIFMILVMFLLTGCNNSVEFDFKENINSKINLSFSLDEYDSYSTAVNGRDEALSAINAIRSDREAFVNGNGERLVETSFINNNDYYNATYEYNYTYSNFKDNSILHSCFEYFGVVEEEDNIYVSLKGKSVCAPFKLIIKADNKMLSSNENTKLNNQYIWNIQEDNNDIYMTISKTRINNSSFDTINLVYLVLALGIGVGVFILNNKIKNHN